MTTTLRNGTDKVWLPVLVALAMVAGTSCRRVERAETDTDAPRSSAQPVAVVTTESGIQMVRIPAGRFDMGSLSGEPDERPVHAVHTDACLMDRHQMTQEHWAASARGHPLPSSRASQSTVPDPPPELASRYLAHWFCPELALL